MEYGIDIENIVASYVLKSRGDHGINSFLAILGTVLESAAKMGGRGERCVPPSSE